MACEINAMVSVSSALPYLCESVIATMHRHSRYVPQNANLGVYGPSALEKYNVQLMGALPETSRICYPLDSGESTGTFVAP